MAELEGGCACGDITYTSSVGAQYLDYCYCTICQQLSGSPFMAFIGVPKDALNWKGNVTERHLTDFATRLLCSNCGSGLGMQYDCYPKKTHIAAGTLKAKNCDQLKVAMHIFVKSKPAWYQIPDDGVAQYDEFDEEFTKALGRHEG